MSKKASFSFFFVLFLAVTVSSAQTGMGQIQGTVTDTTGAVLPNAEVTLRSVQTSEYFRTTTTSVGSFTFPSLRAGDYQITAVAPGLTKWQGKVALAVGQIAVVNPSLAVAGVTETVTVAGDVTPLLTTTSPTLATVVERERIEQLPLNGRSVASLIQTTTPGIEGNSGQPRVFGLRDSAMEFVQDGVPLDDRNTGNLQARPPGLDTVQEFRVETNNSSAKLDRPANAIMSTRGGTSEFHGSAFETGRNSAFGVARRREDRFTKAPPLRRNEYGASIGGPVVLPKLYNGKNKTFFFTAWEDYTLRQDATQPSAVWTDAMRHGDFSGLVDANGRKITIYDPLSVGGPPNYAKTPFSANQIPMDRLSPLAKYVFSVTPLPTDPNINPLVANNYFGLSPTNVDQRTLTFRVDHHFGNKDQVFGRYSHGRWDQLNRRGYNTFGNPITLDHLWNQETYGERSNTEVVSWTHVFSPKLFVETVGTASLIDWVYSLNQPSSQQNISAMLGTPNPFNVNGAPFILNAGYQNVQFHGVLPRSQYTGVVTAEQNYTWSPKIHQIEFGWRYRDEKLDTKPDSPDQSDLDFGSNATALYNPATGSSWGATPQTGDNAANFFLGVAASYGQSRPPGYYNMFGKDVAAYVQDNWKVKPNLTLNLGVRWEYLGPYRDSHGMTAVFDFPSKSLVTNVALSQIVSSGYSTQPIVDAYTALGVKWTTPDKVGLPQDLVTVSKHDFAPRAGFAYNLRLFKKHRFVLRGGYGLYHFPIPARTFSELRLNPPFQGSYSFSWNSSATSPDGLSNYYLRQPPTVIAGVNSTNNVLDISKPPTVYPGPWVTGLAPDLATSRAHQYNLTLETEVMKDTVARVGLIGTAGRNIEMMQLYNYNPLSNYIWFVNSGQPLPQGYYANTVRRAIDQTTYGNIRIYSKIGYSNLFGMQLGAERRYSRGLAFQLFYVLSNSTSTGATPSQGGDFTQNGVPTPEVFLTGSVPQNLEDRIRFYRYARDTDIPQHHIRWNWLYDLPVGRGKKLLGNSGPILDRLVGGWQLAGSGEARSRWWVLPTSNWGKLSTPEIYGKKYPIEDCRSGVCQRGYLYYNGYLPVTVINVGARGVNGIPANYVPSSAPINPAPNADPNFNDTNNVYVRLANGTNQLVSFDNALHPWRNQAMHGPWINSTNASLYKSVRITERVNLRVSVDAFNVFNQPGIDLPNSSTSSFSTSGVLSLQTSGQNARVLQYGARVSW